MSDKLQELDDKGYALSELGLPSYDQYVELRDMIRDYTDGHLLVTSWRWSTAAVEGGQSVGLCIGDMDDQAYWSCWEYFKEYEVDGGDF